MEKTLRLPAFALCVILGTAPLAWLPALPPVAFTGAIILLAALVCLRLPSLRPAGLTALFFCWGVLAAWQEMLPAASLPGRVLQAEVMLTASDGEERHAGRLLSIEGVRQFPPPGITFYGQPLPQKACAGQRWLMRLKVRAVHGQLNEGLFDRQRYAIASHLPLTGRFAQADVIDARCSLRAGFINRLAQSLASRPWRPVMLALAAGERATVSPDVNRLLQQTGTAHLMAISGLHISLLGMLGWGAARALQLVMPGRYLSWRLPLVCALLAMSAYGWLSGFQPPAQRTVVAAACWTLLRLSGRSWSSLDVWLCCIAAILLLDPVAALSESLWLSAFAVGVLIFWFRWVPMGAWPRGGAARRAWGLVHLQLGLLFLLLPIQIAVFNGFSWTSLAANLLAVPLVTLAVIPLLIAGMLLNLLGPTVLEQGAWLLADRLLAGLFWCLRTLPDGWVSVGRQWQGAVMLPWLAVVLWRLRGWQSYRACWLTLGVLALFPLWKRPEPQSWSVTLLDVGQGLSAVIARNGRAILYDTGPAWPGGDSGQQVIVPWLRWQNLRPEGVILSHEHLDHRGGLGSVQAAWPGLWVRSPLREEGHLDCFRGTRWRWQGLTFSVLWPLPDTRLVGNNRSCVVKVDDGKHSALLTGDIEMAGEKMMLSRYWQHLSSTLVQVPHHGSRTSSSPMLLRRVGGAIALASASRYNAWRMPADSVRARYLAYGYRWFDTPRQGQITVTFTAQGWQIRSLRDQILRRWYHPWFGDKGQNG